MWLLPIILATVVVVGAILSQIKQEDKENNTSQPEVIIIDIFEPPDDTGEKVYCKNIKPKKHI